MYAGAAHGGSDNHVSIIGGLAEAARGQTSRKDGRNLASRSAQSGFWLNTLTVLVAAKLVCR